MNITKSHILVKGFKKLTRDYTALGQPMALPGSPSRAFGEVAQGILGLVPALLAPVVLMALELLLRDMFRLDRFLHWLSLGISEAPGVELPLLAAGINLWSS